MSRQYPDRDADFITWAREHVDRWVGGQTPPDVGLPASTLADLQTVLSEAETQWSAHQVTQTDARAQTVSKDQAFGDLKIVLDPAIATITAYAKTSGGTTVYSEAGLNPPKQPGPRPAPDAPTDLEISTFPSGTLELSFKVNAGGAVFEVQRSQTALDGSETAWTTIATTGDKSFLDDAVPSGLRRVQYQVRAVLPTGLSSPWSVPAPFNYGSQGSQGGPLEMAA